MRWSAAAIPRRGAAEALPEGYRAVPTRLSKVEVVAFQRDRLVLGRAVEVRDRGRGGPVARLLAAPAARSPRPTPTRPAKPPGLTI